MSRATPISVAVLMAGCQLSNMTPDMTQLTNEELTAYTVGNVVTLNGDNGTATHTYGVDGSFQYQNPKLNKRGTYAIESGKVCIKYPGQSQFCDTYARKGDAYYYVTQPPYGPYLILGRQAIVAPAPAPTTKSS